MHSPRLRGRYLHILVFFAGVIARFVLWELVLRRIGLRATADRTRTARITREATRFRALAVRMGGVMIKVGQFLSSRLDVLPREVTETLADLQDEVPAEDFEDIRALAETDLGAPLTALLASVDPVPLAAASLGQVHRARLHHPHEGFDGVVLKVQRPGIAAIVDTDLAALRRVGTWLMRYRPIRAHADVGALLREFSTILYQEIDYAHEADNAELFRANLADDPRVLVPRVVRSLSAGRVLTLEDVSAIKLSDHAAITAAGISRTEVAERLVAVYLKQIFEDGFVHADPHPGNLFVTAVPAQPREPGTAEEGDPGEPEAPPTWRLTFVDFGMMARVPDSVRASLRELVVGVGTRDSSRVVKAYQMLDMLLPGADLEAIERAEAQVFDRYWGLSMNELRNIDPQEVREFAHQYRDLLLDLPFQVPQNLIYLVRTVSILSGICTGLDPHVNLWEQVSPYARRLVEEETSSGAAHWIDQIGDALMTVLALPGQTSRVLARAEGRGIAVRDEQAGRAIRSVSRSVDRLSGSVLAAGLVIAGSVLVAAERVGGGVAMMVVAAVTVLGGLMGGGRR
ncbi:ABC1 kinase family protein [Actinotalea sp.]|uniref:ABC1 kinase family protein n=1 Tax=Actinotalea sp. TaxID=1872145 RepID=UPI0035667219